MVETEYAQFLVVGRSEPDPLIDWRVWKELVPLLDPIFGAARKPSLIRMYQETREDEESVTFGRLSWNEKSHAKWTHNSPVTKGKSSDWRFIAAEFWAPSPNLDNDDPDKTKKGSGYFLLPYL